jgi:uncharacterized membrane protein YkvA (DUF1232 family)
VPKKKKAKSPVRKKAKTSPRAKRAKASAARRSGKGSSIREVTVRSRAFAKAILKARPYTVSPEQLEALVREASKKVVSLPAAPFRESWAYLATMLRLLRAYQRGEYENVPPKALLSIVAAVAYLVDPYDLIPDEVPYLGFLDDATVLEFAMVKTRQTLDDFMSWEVKRLVR